MTAAVRGWCPGAHRPMMSGDGLVVRVRPRLGRLSRDQLLGLCNVSERFGHGTLDLTNRANVQIRGIEEAAHIAVLHDLAALDLLDAQPDIEMRRNIIVTPFWQEGDMTERLTKDLLSRLADLPELPSKFGFSIDTGPTPYLQDDPADIRIECTADGRCLIRPDGSNTGQVVNPDKAIDTLMFTAGWFAAHRTGDIRRMRALLAAEGPLPDWTEPAPAPAARPCLGPQELGLHLGAPFGALDARRLAALMQSTKSAGLRITPWRSFILEGVNPAQTQGFIDTDTDPRLRIDACVGAPACAQATVSTRSLAGQMTVPTGMRVHISGCAKGCARPSTADVTLVGRDGAFDLVKGGHAWDEPCLQGLSAQEILKMADLA